MEDEGVPPEHICSAHQAFRVEDSCEKLIWCTCRAVLLPEEAQVWAVVRLNLKLGESESTRLELIEPVLRAVSDRRFGVIAKVRAASSIRTDRTVRTRSISSERLE
jgi:hypothetical protein